MQTKSPQKHVIFLGAGASATSGYPLANGLRLRLSSERQMLADLETALKVRYTDYPQPFTIVRKCFEDFKASIDLFRNGGFGSVDEFSKLASKKYSKHVQAIKRLTRLGLSLHTPEDKFHESDYYPFIQSLFDDKELHTLKPHITVISYNYDCYLEYLLIKSQSHRNHLADVGEPSAFLKNILTSYYFNIDAVAKVPSVSEYISEHFSIYKLHGSIAYAPEHIYKELFEDTAEERLKPFDTHEFQTSITPIVFPWELFDDSGKFITAQQFVFKRDATNDFEHDEAKKLYNLFHRLWKEARVAVQRAGKISFVGMSMHPYLESGLKYLFDGKKGRVQIVVANEENKNFPNNQMVLPPWSVCKRVEDILNKFGTMSFVQTFSQPDDAGPIAPPELALMGQVVPRSSFKEFIEREMD